MNKNCTKRIASLVMVFAMLLSYIPGAVWAVDSTTDIKAIEKPTGWVIVEDYDDYFGDKWLEKLGLPETVKVTLADGSTTDAGVVWDTSVLDTRTTGYYSVPGEVTLPNGATNSQNIGVTITIQVAKKNNLFVNGNFENKGAYVPAGWNMPGLGVRYTTEFARTGSVAGWARGTNLTDVKRNGYNIVSITDYPMSPAAQLSSYSICLPRSSHDYTISLVTGNMLLNILAVQIGTQDKEGLMNNLRRYDEYAQSLEYFL